MINIFSRFIKNLSILKQNFWAGAKICSSIAIHFHQSLRFMQNSRFCLLVILPILLLLAACDKDKSYDKAKAVSLFNLNINPTLDSSLASVAIKLPSQKPNKSWLASAAIQNQVSQNIEKNFNLRQSGLFFAKKQEIFLKKSTIERLFYIGDRDENFVYSPIILQNMAYFLDSAGELFAVDLQNFQNLWRKQVFKKSLLKNYRIARLGVCDDKLFAVAGINEIRAVNRGNGEILWQRQVSSVLTSAPICDGKAVFVISDNNKLYNLSAATGELNWVSSGVARPTAIFGNADPVLKDGLVIAAYSSGEIYGIDKKTGETLWSQDLILSKATSSDFYLNDIDATPLVHDNVVYAVGNGGLLKAMSLKNGEFLWKKEIASVVDFWLAGDFLFVINNDNKLLAIHKKTGGIKWAADLPAFENPKKPASKFVYSGLIMAGDKLVISRADGVLIIVSPFDGKIEKTFDLGRKIFHSPAIVNDKIYIHSIGSYRIELAEFI